MTRRQRRTAAVDEPERRERRVGGVEQHGSGRLGHHRGHARAAAGGTAAAEGLGCLLLGHDVSCEACVVGGRRGEARVVAHLRVQLRRRAREGAPQQPLRTPPQPREPHVALAPHRRARRRL